MKKPRFILLALSLAVAILLVGQAQAIKITAFIDTPTFVDRAQDIVIAQCVGPVPDPRNYHDALYPVDVQVVMTLKVAKQPGKLKISSIYPMEAGKTYLLTSLGGSAQGTDFLAVPELAVVEVPANFKLEELKGKAVVDQVQAVFAARRQENERLQELLAQEKKLLDQAVGK